MSLDLSGLPTSPHLSYVMEGDAPAALITLPNARAKISFVGAHVMSFETRDGNGWREQLWLPPLARPMRGKAMRGGIPLCWPWFGPHKTDKSLPQHGVARIALWDVINATDGATDNAGAYQSIAFNLPPSAMAGVPGLDPQAVTLRCLITVHDDGELHLALTTIGLAGFTFSEAFHTYFRVADVRQVAVHGLDGGTYRDQADNNLMKDLSGPFDFSREVNAHFPHRGGPQTIVDPAGQRTIRIETSNAQGTTVWHPGPEAPQKFAEIPAAVAHQFVCVESGNLPENPVMFTETTVHEVVVRYAFRR
ncbi:MAG: hypothetical protein RL291_776 [Pseudomonadota bacterium]